jgi:hypothetical protein
MRSSFLQEFQRAARISQRDRQRRGVGDAAREHVISPISRAARKVVVAIVAPSSNSPRATSTASVASRTGNQRNISPATLARRASSGIPARTSSHDPR